MAADIEEEAFTERKTMRKTAGNRREKLIVDRRVEVRSFEEGFQGSWHSGTVVACKKAIRRVQYDHLLFDDHSSSKLIDFVEVPAIVDGIISTTNSSPSNYRGWIRPLLPPLDCDIWLLHYGQCVDMFYQDAWWEGVVFDHQDGSPERVIFFPDMGDEMKVHIDDLRITQDWDENTEVWKPRGNWLFLKVIEEIEKDWPLLVSVRQIWYDVRVKKSFANLNEWTSALSDIWKELALEVIVDNFKITVKEFFHHSKSSANLLQGGYQLLELNEFALDAIVKQKAYFGDSRAIVPVETTGQLNRACCHPFEEEIGRDDLASVMESCDRLDKIPLASSIKPSHEAPFLSSPAAAILPSNLDELSKDSSNFKMPKRRTRLAWIPAGPDIVPEAEYCADAINEYYKLYSMSKAGHKRSVDIKLNARKHLAFLGWKIEISREKGVQRVRYVQPGSDGKCFPSLTTVCEYLRESDSKPDELSLSTNSKMRIQSTQRNWLRAGLDVVPEAEFCENAIIEYYNIFKAGNLPPKDLAVNAKKHLSFLGWKIEYLQEKGSQRWRYTRPGRVGKCFESLIKVCEYLRKSAPGIVSLFPQDEHLSPLIEQSQGCKDKLIKPSPNFIVESEYCPEAVMDYYLLGGKSKDDPRKWKRYDKLKDMQLKAKKHLSAVGWRFYYTYRTDNKGSRELRYSSPSGKVYTSLIAACKGCVVEERNVWKEAEGQLTSEASLEVHGAFISQRPLSEKWQAEPSGLSLSSEVADLGKVKVQRIRKRGRKRKSIALHLASRSSKSLKKEKDLKEGQTIKSRENLNVAVSTHVLRSSKRARQVVVPSSSHSNPRTVLSWLIDNNVVLPRAKVQYRGRRDEGTLAEGRVTRDGIRCSCCQYIFTLSDFEGHAGSIYHRPSANIFLEDGRSLLDCQLQLKRNINARSYARESREMKSNQHHNKNDYICSVCHFGGELVLCDRCPSSFHTCCLSLKEVPDGDWFCPSCCCKICGQSKVNKDIEEFTDSSVINCHQCELQYHIGCLRMKGLVPDGHPKGLWFCNKRCEQISLGLQKLLGKPVPVGVDNLTWTLLRYAPDSCDRDPSNIEDSTETYSKLNVALGVMHECFEPVKEPRTRRDLVEDVIFNRWSELNRLNFRGFYTVLLEKNDELITAATVRVYGEKVAEVPLVATRFLYRRRGMCRILMNELEKALVELGVERLVLPAVSSVLDTWISSFGFSRMTETERLNYLDYMFLDFQGTIMCQKLLIKTPCTESVPLRAEKQLFDVISGNDNMDLEGGSVSKIFQADRVEDSGTVDQKSGNTARGNGNDGGKDAAALVILVNQPTGFESIPCQSEISLQSLVEASNYKEAENHGNGQIICYKRRKISKPVGAEVSSC